MEIVREIFCSSCSNTDRNFRLWLIQTTPITGFQPIRTRLYLLALDDESNIPSCPRHPPSAQSPWHQRPPARERKAEGDRVIRTPAGASSSWRARRRAHHLHKQIRELFSTDSGPNISFRSMHFTHHHVYIGGWFVLFADVAMLYVRVVVCLSARFFLLQVNTIKVCNYQKHKHTHTPRKERGLFFQSVLSFSPKERGKERDTCIHIKGSIPRLASSTMRGNKDKPETFESHISTPHAR